MERPRALVIPFGVPDGGKGLGIGLASLVHSFARVGDGDVALAQIRSHGSDGGVTGIVEAFVTGAQWRAMPGAEDTPAHVSMVLTGAFEPPREGRGAFSVLAFDAKTGEFRAKCDAVLDADGAGRSIFVSLESICARVGGDVSALRGLESLNWDALESVLLAETWRVRTLNGSEPSGATAVLAHLGRAVSEAREATFPAERLATVAIELARFADTRVIETALRTLIAASDDMPTNASLESAAAALCLRLGNAPNAIIHAERAIERDAARAFPHALLSEAKRVNGDLPGAERAIANAIAIDETDPHVRNERAAVLVACGDLLGARHEWQKLLASHGLHVPAFMNLAAIAIEHGDVALAQSLVDHALATRTHATPEVLRRAVQVALQLEGASVARGSRLAALCKSLCDREPKDGVAVLLLARALAEMGERGAALEKLRELEDAAKGSIVAAEASRMRLHVTEPLVAAAIDAAVRAASEADVRELGALAARARRLAIEHESWVAELAASISLRRLGQLERAHSHASRALELAPTAPLVHLEHAAIHLAMKDAAAAIVFAKRAIELDPLASRAHAILGEALLASGDHEAAHVAAAHALELAPNDAHATSLRDRASNAGERERTSWIARLLKR